jgi:hypothetical protein
VLAQQQAPAPGAQQQQQPQQQQQGEQARQTSAWERLPKMQLEQMFAGPLQDTIVQRWRDPQTGALCYLYLPFTVQHGARTATGAVLYGPNTIGSISCLESGAPRVAGAPPATAAKKPPAHAPARAGEASGQ